MKCPVCGSETKSACGEPYCSTCHWRVRRARKEVLTTSLWFLLWTALLWAIFSDSGKTAWIALPLLAVFVLWGVVETTRALIKLSPINDSAEQGEPYVKYTAVQKPDIQPRSSFAAWVMYAFGSCFIIVCSAVISELLRDAPKIHMAIIGPFVGVLLGGKIIVKTWKDVRSQRFLVREGAATLARVIKRTRLGRGAVEITYEFCDEAGRVSSGTANDSEPSLHPGSEVVVLYDSKKPSRNVAAHALLEFEAADHDSSP
jgi:hypothetical protein